MAQTAGVQRASKVLDEEIAALREQVALARRRRTKQSSTDVGTTGRAQAGQEQAPSDVFQTDSVLHEQGTDWADQLDIEQRDASTQLGIRIQRLEQIQNWITADGDLLPLFAKVVGHAENKYMMRNLLVNIALSTIFLVAGWLLSIIATPTNLSDIFRH